MEEGNPTVPLSIPEVDKVVLSSSEIEAVVALQSALETMQMAYKESSSFEPESWTIS